MPDRKSVTLDYYAVLREVRKKERETVSTAARTMLDLYEELRALHAFPLPFDAMRVAVNDEFTTWEQEIQEGDRVVFIAPVAGG